MSTTTKAAPTDTGACGTPKGHQRHHRKGEQPCGPCQASRIPAQRAYRAERARSRRLRVTAEDRQAARAALPLRSGRLACTSRRHPFTGPVGATICSLCWGWVDDPRHPVLGGPVVGR